MLIFDHIINLVETEIPLQNAIFAAYNWQPFEPGRK